MGNRETLARLTASKSKRDSPRCVRTRDRVVFSARKSELKQRSQHRVDELTARIESGGDSAVTRCHRGHLYVTMGLKGEALCDFNAAIGLEPEFVDAHFSRGALFTDLGLKEDALRDFTRVIELAPSNASGHCRLGNVYADLGRFDDALGSYNHAIELNPSYAIFFYRRGSLYRRMGESDSDESGRRYDFDLAMSDFDQALHLMSAADQRRGFVLYWRSVLFGRTGRIQEGVNELCMSISLHSEPIKFYDRAVLQWKQKRSKIGVRSDLYKYDQLMIRKMIGSGSSSSSSIRSPPSPTGEELQNAAAISKDQIEFSTQEEIRGQNILHGVYRREPESEPVDVFVKLLGRGFGIPFSRPVMRAQIEVMTTLNHVNLMECFGLYEDKTVRAVGIVFRKFAVRSLREWIDEKRDFSERLSCLAQLARGLSYLHSLGLAHRSISPVSIFVSEDGTIKIGDGFDRYHTSSASVTFREIDLPCYRPPPSVTFRRNCSNSTSEQPADHYKEIDLRKDDVYSFGIIGWEILTGWRAFFEERRVATEDSDIILELTIHESDPVIRPSWNGFVDVVPEEIRELLNRCWDPDDARRPDMETVVTTIDEFLVSDV